VHPDWQVRLVAAEVLGRFRSPESSIALTRLVADPVPAVSHRALAALDH
jgi:HEAT repeat protein